MTTPAEHEHRWNRRTEVRRYPASGPVGIYRCSCGDLFARPLDEEESDERDQLEALTA